MAACLGDDRVQGDVPGSCRDPAHALTFVGETDQARPAPESAGLEIGECAVVIAAAHADPVTRAIEADQREQQQIEPAHGAESARADPRLWDAEPIHAHALARQMTGEPQPWARIRPETATQDREIDPLAALQRRPDQRTWIELAIGWPVGGEITRALITKIALEGVPHRERVVTLGLGRERATRGT